MDIGCVGPLMTSKLSLNLNNFFVIWPSAIFIAQIHLNIKFFIKVDDTKMGKHIKGEINNICNAVVLQQLNLSFY